MAFLVAACGDNDNGHGNDNNDNGGPQSTRTPAAATPTAVAPTATNVAPTATNVVATVTPTEQPTGPAPTATPSGPQLLAARVATAPSGLDDAVWASAAPLTPTLATASSGLLYGDGQLNMNGLFNGLPDFNDGAPANLDLRAVHDGTKLYILAQWNDTTFNVDRRRWLFDGPTDPLKPGESAAGFTSQLNDDKIAFAFEIEPASSEFGPFSTAGCAASCHNVSGEGLDMRPASGKVDIWHWKTSRSEPLGYVDDQVTDPDNGRVDDAGTSIEHRNRPSGGNDRSGPAFEWDGTTQSFTRWDGATIDLDPAYFILDGHQTAFEGDAAAGDAIYDTSCSGCHGAQGQGGIGPALTAVQFTRISRADLATAIAAPSHPGASAFNALSATDQTNVIARLRGFSGVPGYYLTPPAGSVADLLTQSNVAVSSIQSGDLVRTNYRLLIIRNLDTGNADDRQFQPGNSYTFGVALMDDDGRNHIGSTHELLTIAP